MERSDPDTLEGGRSDERSSRRVAALLLPVGAILVIVLAVIGWLAQGHGRQQAAPPVPTSPAPSTTPVPTGSVRDLVPDDSFGYNMDQRCRCAVVRIPLFNPNHETALVRSVRLSGPTSDPVQVEALVLPTTVAEAGMGDPRERPPLLAQRIALGPDGGAAALVVWLRPDCGRLLPLPMITVRYTVGAARHSQRLPDAPLDGHNRPALAGLVHDICAG